MTTDKGNEFHEQSYLRMTKRRLEKAAVHFERFADELRRLSEGDRLDARLGYGEAVADAVGGLGNVLANARMENIVQMACSADTYRELARQQRELETGAGE